jgi:hypothetical protein
VLDAHASDAHFLDHIAPVWAALPPEQRGSLGVPRHLLAQARALRLPDVEAFTSGWQRRRGPVLVAAYGDLRNMGRRPIVFMEHGAGQSYTGGRAHQSYAGGMGRERVVLFLNPSERVARLNAERYPRSTSVVIGCPKLDGYHRRPPMPSNDPPVVAVAWHWKCDLWPEAVGALDHYRSALPDLAQRFTVLGHGHPRLWRDPRARLEATYRDAGIEPVPSFTDVLDRADVLVCDNSSVLWEFASTGRPVVVANAPWYRRNVHHGMRFWEYADVGVQVDEPAGLVDAVAAALTDPPEQRERREAICNEVYAYRDGGAARAAVRAIIEWLQVARRAVA